MRRRRIIAFAAVILLPVISVAAERSLPTFEKPFVRCFQTNNGWVFEDCICPQGYEQNQTATTFRGPENVARQLVAYEEAREWLVFYIHADGSEKARWSSAPICVKPNARMMKELDQ